MSISFDPNATGRNVQSQAQVSVIKQARDLQKQSALQLISSATPQVHENAPNTAKGHADPAHIGRNLNVSA